MKVSELMPIINTALTSLNNIKQKNIKIVKHEILTTRAEAKVGDHCRVLFKYDSVVKKGNGYFGISFDLWKTFENSRHVFNYTKMVIRWIWESLKKAEERVIRIPTIQHTRKSSTLGSSFGRVGSIGNSIDIANKVDTCAAIIPSSPAKPVRISDYNKTDVMMTGKLFDIMKQEKTKGYLKAPICKPYLLK